MNTLVSVALGEFKAERRENLKQKESSVEK